MKLRVRTVYGTWQCESSQYCRTDDGRLSRLLNECHRGKSVAGCARRLETGTPPRALRDGADGPAIDKAVSQVRGHGGRGVEKLSPTWRCGGLRLTGQHA